MYMLLKKSNCLTASWCLQAETYRRMRKVNKNSWEQSTLATNCLWMRYLADIFLEKVHIYTATEKLELRKFRNRASNYSGCGEMIWDDFFAGQFSYKANQGES